MVFYVEFALESSMVFVSGVSMAFDVEFASEFVKLGLIPYEDFPSSQMKFRLNRDSSV